VTNSTKAMLLFFIEFRFDTFGDVLGSILIVAVLLLVALALFNFLREHIALSKLKEGDTPTVVKAFTEKHEFNLKLPLGWQAHPVYENEFLELKKRRDNFGKMETYSLSLEANEDFQKFVDRQMKEYLQEIYGKKEAENPSSYIISRETKWIDNREVVQALVDLENAVELQTYVLDGSEYLWIDFHLLKDDFFKQETEIKKAIDSITSKRRVPGLEGI
jgi:hypothetical protein